MRSRGLAIVFGALALMGLSGCEHGKEMVNLKKTPEPQLQATAMEAGETRNYQFKADGLWHNSGILVLYRDSLLIKPQGLTDGLALGVLQCRAGGNPLYVDGEQAIRFENNAPLEFMVVKNKSNGFAGPAEVTITKRAGRRKAE